MSQTRAIGIFGGTFDPVHFGHLRAATEAGELLPLDRFHLLPAGSPPHRSHTFASAEHRLAMLHLATGDYPELVVDDREVRRAGQSYMVDTLAEFRDESGDAETRRPGQSRSHCARTNVRLRYIDLGVNNR